MIVCTFPSVAALLQLTDSLWVRVESEYALDLRSLPKHRLVLAIWHVFMLLALLWLFTRPRGDEPLHWIWIPVIVTPVLILAATFMKMLSRHRAIAYWVLAAICVPTAAGGLVSVIGPLFIVSIVLLIWAARREDPAEEIVQM